MVNIFNEEDALYIRKAIDNQYQANLAVLGRLKDGQASGDDLLLLVDIVNDDFSRNGLDIHDEPNDYGLKLESIIDRLNSPDEP